MKPWLGYAAQIDATIHIDNSITVVDDGRGIPMDDMVVDGEKLPAAQVVFYPDCTPDKPVFRTRHQ
jgi:DNA gyrase/topoisomerase IV subunit B